MKLLRLAALACVLSALTAAASAEEAVWSVAGREVFRLRATVGKWTPSRRVDELDGRLTEILSKEDAPLRASDIVLKVNKGATAIYVRGMLLVTVAKEDATACKTTPKKLGQSWLRSLRNTLPLVSPRVNPGGA